MKTWTSIMLLFIGLACIVIIGCNTYLDRFTPSNLPEKSLDYINKEPNDYGWFHSLYDAEQVMLKIISTRRDRLIDWEYWLKKDETAYQDAKGYLEPAIIESRQAQEIAIGSKERPYSILGIMSYLGIGGGALLFGKEKLTGSNHITKDKNNADIIKAKEEVRTEFKKQE